MGWSSKTGVQEAPPFSVFHTPPLAVPRKIIFGLVHTASIAVTRPLMPAGPILRGFMFLKCLDKSTCWAYTAKLAAIPTKAKSNFLIKEFGFRKREFRK